jgi:hypothetical protein
MPQRDVLRYENRESATEARGLVSTVEMPAEQAQQLAEAARRPICRAFA